MFFGIVWTGLWMTNVFGALQLAHKDGWVRTLGQATDVASEP